VSKRAVKPAFAWGSPAMSQGVALGDLVFVSGQVALDESGNLVGEGDTRAQAEQCFRNVEAVLAAAGLTLDDIVKLTCFLAADADPDAYQAVRHDRFSPRAVPPARTTVVVARLLHPGFLVEFEAIAGRVAG
jgi:reactive intermediate/imine deaminase